MPRISSEPEARLLARAILSDAHLYHPSGGEPLASAFEQGRELFRGRTEPALHAIYEAELAVWKPPAADAKHQQPRTSSGYRSWKAILGALVVVAIVVGLVWSMWQPGEEVAFFAIPGETRIPVRRGDVLGFQVDTEVLWPRATRRDKPSGCTLTLDVGVESWRATSRCDPFRTSEHTSASGFETRGERGGLGYLKIARQRVACRVEIPRDGTATVRGSSNLGRCVTRSLGAGVHVYLDRSDRER